MAMHHVPCERLQLVLCQPVWIIVEIGMEPKQTWEVMLGAISIQKKCGVAHDTNALI